MEREKVLQALDLCTKEYPKDFCPCDHCPMMEAGCDEADFQYVSIPRQLLIEIYKHLDPQRTEFTHVKYIS